MIPVVKIAVTLCSAAIVTACTPFKKTTREARLPASLKEVYQNDFLMGVAISLQQIEEKDPVAIDLIPQQFNALTPENIMKAEKIHPEWNKYDFSAADKMITYAGKQNMVINGHTLIWHSQMPEFARRIQNADSFRTFFTNHINTVAKRYSGKLQSWDVVNEALNEDGTLRQTPFLKHLGESYITEAFRLTAAVEPNADLYYNDYNNEQPKKRAGCISIIKKIQAAGIKIDGVGIQGHWHVGRVPFADIEASIIEYAALGLKVAFTELDIEVLPRNFTGAEISQTMQAKTGTNPYVNGLPDSVQQQLAADYERLFELFLKHKDKVSRVTLWGVHDGQSWLNGWPIPGRTNYPLLFDRQGKPKPAFNKVITLKTKRAF